MWSKLRKRYRHRPLRYLKNRTSTRLLRNIHPLPIKVKLFLLQMIRYHRNPPEMMLFPWFEYNAVPLLSGFKMVRQIF